MTIPDEHRSLLDRKLLFVTGKGGVGKTTVTAGLGLLAAGLGMRALVCDVDATGDVSAFFEAGPFRFQETEVLANLWAMSMDTEASLREYLKLYLKVPVIGRIGALAKVFEFVATAAPGVREVLVVGKLCWEVKQGHWDIVIVDSPASGHIIGHLAAPQAINQLARTGLIRSQTGWMTDILSDPAKTGTCIVTTPEEMPVNETLDLATRLRSETTVSLASVIVNRVFPELFNDSEEEVFEAISSGRCAAKIEQVIGPEASTVLAAARLAVTLRRSKAKHLERLRSEIEPSVPILYLPYIFSHFHGLRTTRKIAQAISEEIGI